LKRKIVAAVFGAVLALSMIGGALAAPGPGVNNCWGTVVSQRATYYGDIGEHIKLQSEPRLGVGNLAKLFQMTVGELASFLSFLDDFTGDDPAGVTHCP
jgi:hypothetical protein